ILRKTALRLSRIAVISKILMRRMISKNCAGCCRARRWRDILNCACAGVEHAEENKRQCAAENRKQRRLPRAHAEDRETISAARTGQRLIAILAFFVNIGSGVTRIAV